MFLQTSFLVFSSTVHTRLTSADPTARTATDIESTSKTIDIMIGFIFVFLYSKGCTAGGGPNGLAPNADANDGVGAPPKLGLPELTD